MAINFTYEEALQRLPPEVAAQHPDAPGPKQARSKSIRRSKYNAARSRYRGIRCDSKAERSHFEALDFDPTVAWWIDHPRFRLTEHDVYEADALVVLKSPISYDYFAIEAHDVKGYRTRRFNHMLELWEAYGPCALVIIYRGRRQEVVVPQKEEVRGQASTSEASGT